MQATLSRIFLFEGFLDLSEQVGYLVKILDFSQYSQNSFTSLAEFCRAEFPSRDARILFARPVRILRTEFSARPARKWDLCVFLFRKDPRDPPLVGREPRRIEKRRFKKRGPCVSWRHVHLRALCFAKCLRDCGLVFDPRDHFEPRDLVLFYCADPRGHVLTHARPRAGFWPARPSSSSPALTHADLFWPARTGSFPVV